MALYGLIFANGELADGPAVRACLEFPADALLIAADGGARHALALGLTPYIVVGDFDSLSAPDFDALAAKGVDLRRHSVRKDETDLELALLVAAEHDCDPIRIIGGIGGRLDQTLGNVYLLALPVLRGRDVRLVSGAQTTWLARPGAHHIEGQPGDTLSLLPVGGDVVSISSDGLEYPLHHETLRFGPARGISNVLLTTSARVSFEAGLLLFVHTLGRA